MPCLLVEQPVFFVYTVAIFSWLKHIWKLGFLQFYYYYCKKSQMESEIEPVTNMLEIKPGNSLDLMSYEHVNPHYRSCAVGWDLSKPAMHCKNLVQPCCKQSVCSPSQRRIDLTRSSNNTTKTLSDGPASGVYLSFCEGLQTVWFVGGLHQKKFRKEQRGREMSRKIY
jgi:hypothetical protein